MHIKTEGQQNGNTRKKVQQTVMWTDCPSLTAQKNKILHLCAKKLCSVWGRSGRDHPALDSSSVLWFSFCSEIWCCGVQLYLFTYYLCCRHRQHDKHMESLELKSMKMVQERQTTYAYNRRHANKSSLHHTTSLRGHAVCTTLNI
jgi:hypothetical protein